MKIIFLDIDGVLNSAGSFLYEDRRRKRHPIPPGRINETLCPVCSSNFQYVLDKHKDAKIVISSTWRELYSLEWLKEKLKSYGIDSKRVIDRTPISTIFYDRGAEIQSWLRTEGKELGVKHYIIIDDNDDELSAKHGADKFVHTSWESGMTFAHAQEAAKKLKMPRKKTSEEV